MTIRFLKTLTPKLHFTNILELMCYFSVLTANKKCFICDAFENEDARIDGDGSGEKNHQLCPESAPIFKSVWQSESPKA